LQQTAPFCSLSDIISVILRLKKFLAFSYAFV